MRRQRLLLAVGVLALTVGVVLGIGYATAADPVNHGISVTKGCSSPTSVGQPYSCTYSIRNNIDDAQDTLTVNGLVDVVHSAGGDVTSGNVFSQLRHGGRAVPARLLDSADLYGRRRLSGTGTDANPWAGATIVHAAVRLAASTCSVVLVLHGARRPTSISPVTG